MNIFQYIGIIIIGLLIISSLRSFSLGRSSGIWTIGWILVWLAGGGAILYPESTTRIARSIGIDRGADLISYCAVLGFLIGYFVMYLKYRKIQNQITGLVREIALNKAEIAGRHLDTENEREKKAESVACDAVHDTR